jgi:hypothetical protein
VRLAGRGSRKELEVFGRLVRPFVFSDSQYCCQRAGSQLLNHSRMELAGQATRLVEICSGWGKFAVLRSLSMVARLKPVVSTTCFRLSRGSSF